MHSATPSQPENRIIDRINSPQLAMARLPVTPEMVLEQIRGTEETFQKVIMQRLPIYQMLAQKAGFWIEFGESTSWDHDRRTIILNMKDFMGKGMNLSPSMIDYLILHELGHMKELYDDPTGYADIIETGKERYGEAAFRLYNCLMDAYVNSHSAQIAPLYGSSREASGEVQDFYRNQAFKNRDFSSQPHAFQFAHYLLNLAMGVHEDITLSPEVEARIAKGIKEPGGGTIDYRKFIDLYMRPPVEQEQGDVWRGHVSQRKRIIDRLIRPDFESYLQEDLAAGRVIEVPYIPGVGTLMPISSLKKILKDAERVKKEGKPSTADREMDRQLRDIGKELQMPVAKVNEFIETFQEMKPTINSLARVWDELRFIGVRKGVAKQGHFTHGCDLDMQRVINNYPQVHVSPEEARVMVRRIPYDERVPVPRHFNLRLIIDTSGSMSIIQQEVRSAALALGASLYVKNQESNLSQEKIRCGLEVHRFSGGSKVILPCTDAITMKSLMKWFPEVTMGGGTADHIALGEINRAIGPKETAQIQSGERVEIVVEITDGDTCSPTDTVKELRRLEQKGVLVGAVNLAPQRMREVFSKHLATMENLQDEFDVEEDDIEEYDRNAQTLRQQMRLSYFQLGRFSTFHQIWNSGAFKRGLDVTDPRELPNALSQMISRFIELSPALREIE